MMLPVNAMYSGMQPDGHWAGTPTLVIHLMQQMLAPLPAPESLDGSYPLVEWEIDAANEVSMNRLLERRGSSAHYTNVGAMTLATIAASYRERHVLVVGRDLGQHELAPLVRQLLAAGRTVQVETTTMTPSLVIPGAWLTLLALPSRTATAENTDPQNADRADEILACIRWKADLDRSELVYGRRKAPVWLRPSAFADEGIYRQCVAVASRHAGWRVMRPFRLLANAID